MPCQEGHLRAIQVQEFQRIDQVGLLTPEYVDIALAHFSLSAWNNSVCLGAAGLIPLYPGRFIAWALLSRHAGPFMLPLTRKIRRVIALHDAPRIECTVAADFAAGHKWAKAIGLELETPKPLRKHGPNGEDEMLYARVK